MSSVLIVIPSYNEEKTISGVIQQLRSVAPAFDRLIIDDGSADATSAIVENMGEKCIRLPCNLGYGLALQTGLSYALQHNYDVIVCMDADGQHRPQDVPDLVRVLNEETADMVIGSRYCLTKSYKGPFERIIGQKIFSHLTRLFIGQRIYDTSSRV